MEGTKEVEKSKRRTRPPRGRRGDQAGRPLTPTHLRSDAKRFSCAWKKASR